MARSDSVSPAPDSLTETVTEFLERIYPATRKQRLGNMERTELLATHLLPLDGLRGGGPRDTGSPDGTAANTSATQKAILKAERCRETKVEPAKKREGHGVRANSPVPSEERGRGRERVSGPSR